MRTDEGGWGGRLEGEVVRGEEEWGGHIEGDVVRGEAVENFMDIIRSQLENLCTK